MKKSIRERRGSGGSWRHEVKFIGKVFFRYSRCGALRHAHKGDQRMNANARGMAAVEKISALGAKHGV